MSNQKLSTDLNSFIGLNKLPAHFKMFLDKRIYD